MYNSYANDASQAYPYRRSPSQQQRQLPASSYTHNPQQQQHSHYPHGQQHVDNSYGHGHLPSYSQTPGAGPSTQLSTFDPNPYYRQPSPAHAPALPFQLEPTLSSHPSWASLSPSSSYREDRTGRSNSYWETPINSPMFHAQAFAIPPSYPPPTLGTSQSSWEKAKEADRSSSGDGLGESWPGQEEPDVKKAVEQLRTHLEEIVNLTRPYSASPHQPNPPKPPAHVRSRLSRLSRMIHASLSSLSPQVSQMLAPEFTAAPPMSGHPVEMSAAEKEMEMIRKRRDALIAKAAQPANSTIRVNCLTNSSSSPLIPSSNLSREPSRSFETPIVSPANHPSVGRSLMEYDVALHGGNALGRCHGCGISVTEEWRRGPDGPRSLCDSCGAHYAKLSKKRTADGEPAGSMPQVLLPAYQVHGAF